MEIICSSIKIIKVGVIVKVVEVKTVFSVFFQPKILLNYSPLGDSINDN